LLLDDASVYSIRITPDKLAKIIDHTNLRPYTTKQDIKKLCSEAKRYQFGAICVNPHYVLLCKEFLRDSEVEIAAVIGFPLGSTTSETKAFETRSVIEAGATEIDMVMNIGAFRNGDFEFVQEDIYNVVKAADGAIVKVILETGYLTDVQIAKACKIAKAAEANFVKTSTGFGPMGAYYDHVKLMRETVGEKFGVKAAGGIRTAKAAVRMVNAGANRIGTSTGVKIIEDLKKTIANGKWFDEKDDKPEEIFSWGAANSSKQPKEIYEYYIKKRERFYKNSGG